MKGMMMIGGYEEHPSFKKYGVKVENAPDEPFEATVTLQITRQDNPVDGEPCVEFTVLDIQSDAIDIERVGPSEKMDSGDSLAAGLEEVAMKKAKKKMAVSSESEDGEDY